MKITHSPWFTLTAYEGDEKPDAPEGGGDLQTQFTAAVEKATEGLKNTNKALKEEKKAESEKLKALLNQFDDLGGADGVKNLMAQRAEMLKTEEGKRLASGKHEEWLGLKTTAMRKDHENQLTAVREEAKKIAEERDASVSELRTLRLSVDVSRAMTEGKVRTDSPALADDILAAAEKVFTYDPDRKAMVIKEDGGVVFGKDGKTPKTVTEWLNEQQESRRHWWGDSVGGGARGSVNGGPQGENPWTAANWNMTKQGDVIKSRGIAAAEKMAAAAGSKVGAVRPAAK